MQPASQRAARRPGARHRGAQHVHGRRGGARTRSRRSRRTSARSRTRREAAASASASRRTRTCCRRPRSACEILEEIGHAGSQFNYDPGNVVYYTGADARGGHRVRAAAPRPLPPEGPARRQGRRRLPAARRGRRRHPGHAAGARAARLLGTRQHGDRVHQLRVAAVGGVRRGRAGAARRTGMVSGSERKGLRRAARRRRGRLRGGVRLRARAARLPAGRRVRPRGRARPPGGRPPAPPRLRPRRLRRRRGADLLRAPRRSCA